MQHVVVFAVLRCGAIAALPMLTPKPNTTEKLLLSASRTRCGPQEAQRAIMMLPSGQKSHARSSPCLSDVAPLYETGMEDPTDAVEFLGKVESTEDATCKKKMFPAFLYLGMEHAGSTTLADELNRHKQLSYGRAKEHRFWTRFGHNVFASTTKEYQDEFHVDCKVAKTFDGTPNLYALPLENPREACHVFLGAEGKGATAMRTLNATLGSQTQLLVMLRDPIKVAQSRFPDKTWQYQSLFATDFCECFHTGIVDWMSYFPKQQFHFLRSEDLFQKPEQTLDGVFDFLGVERPDYSHRVWLKSGRRRTASKTSGSMHMYRKDIRSCRKRLEALTDLELPWGKAASL